MLAEDDPDIRRLVGYKLGRSGFQVVAVGDGLAALSAIRSEPPGLAIVDMQMPELSGLEVCRLVRTDPATAGVPILMLTARARPQDAELAFAAGVDEYMVKPFSPRELLLRVEAILARVRA